MTPGSTSTPRTAPTRLGEIAACRSGDKGNHANLSIVALDPADYTYLARTLTPERVQDYFAPLGVTHVERFDLPRVAAFNFLLHNALAGGASRSLRLDTQGKLLGTAAAEITLPPDA